MPPEINRNPKVIGPFDPAYPTVVGFNAVFEDGSVAFSEERCKAYVNGNRARAVSQLMVNMRPRPLWQAWPLYHFRRTVLYVSSVVWQFTWGKGHRLLPLRRLAVSIFGWAARLK